MPTAEFVSQLKRKKIYDTDEKMAEAVGHVREQYDLFFNRTAQIMEEILHSCKPNITGFPDIWEFALRKYPDTSRIILSYPEIFLHTNI
jgi:hypothetical protein